MNTNLSFASILIRDEIMESAKALDGKQIALKQGYIMGLAKALKIVDQRIEFEKCSEKAAEVKTK